MRQTNWKITQVCLQISINNAKPCPVYVVATDGDLHMSYDINTCSGYKGVGTRRQGTFKKGILPLP